MQTTAEMAASPPAGIAHILQTTEAVDGIREE